jgi:hypothetical protein
MPSYGADDCAQMYRVGTRVRAALVVLIYKKSFVLSNASRQVCVCALAVTPDTCPSATRSAKL